MSTPGPLSGMSDRFIRWTAAVVIVAALALLAADWWRRREPAVSGPFPSPATWPVPTDAAP